MLPSETVSSRRHLKLKFSIIDSYVKCFGKNILLEIKISKIGGKIKMKWRREEKKEGGERKEKKGRKVD